MTPDQFTIQEIFVDTGNGHQLYVQEWGNPEANTPIIHLHGGPGGRSRNTHRQLYNPYEQRIIFFDQRGCGRSLPYGSLENNTTKDLVEDIERITKQLKIDRFILTGASWGSCLALAYAVYHPSRVAGMALRGIFTGAQAEIDYFENGDFRTFFPEVWENYIEQVPKSHRQRPSTYHFERILGNDPVAMRKSAYAYSVLENSLTSLDDRFSPEDQSTFDPTGTRIEAHYLVNRCFMPDRFILSHASKLTMPVWMVQGRYDFVCPPAIAYELHKVIPNSTLIWTMAGHGNDRSNYDVMRTIFAHWS